MPLRVIYRRAIDDGVVAVSPVERVRLPAVRGRRERIASREEAAALLEALPADVRVVYAIAFYAGLRLGELRALRWDDVDVTRGVIRVRASMDHLAGRRRAEERGRRPPRADRRPAPRAPARAPPRERGPRLRRARSDPGPAVHGHERDP